MPAQMTDKSTLKLIEQAEKQVSVSLVLSNRQLTAIPAEVFKLRSLKSLDLSNNKLKKIPSDIGKLNSLSWLDISQNQLVQLPAEIGSLRGLTALNLSGNRLSTVPPEIKHLCQLTSLDLSTNCLSSITTNIRYLTNLAQLDLSNNKLRNLPSGVTKVERLIWLYISNNKISKIPSRISQLRELSELKLRGNQINELPIEVSKLVNLRELDLRDNKLGWPDDIVNSVKSPHVLFDFLTQLKEKTEERLYEAKLLIIGEADAGKTSLAKKLKNASYSLQSDEQSTVGIDVSTWKYKYKNRRFRINIWDFSGQEIDHSTHQFFLTEQSLYVLVSDNRREDTNFQYWLGVVKAKSNNSPLLIVQNERQGRRREISETQLGRQCSNLRGTFSTNLSDNTGLSRVSEAIKLQVEDLPHIGTTLPKSWAQVKEALEKENSSYISQSAFFNICDHYEITEEESKLRLSRYLHSLGVCLHFQDNISLSERLFLKPTWLTDAIYRILIDSQIEKDRGKFNQKSLRRIWPEKEYADMRSKLIELMIKFRMCYEIPSRQGNYIIPQLLRLDSPKEIKWDDLENLVLIYRYPFMPRGIVSQLIVRMNSLIYENSFWRSGVILHREGMMARVIEDYRSQSGEIEIRVLGTRKRDFLGEIVTELDKITSTFNNIKCEKLVPCHCISCKGSIKPHLYKFENLKERLRDGKFTVECNCRPYDAVEIHSLIEDYNLNHLLNDEASSEQTSNTIHIGGDADNITITIGNGNSIST
ncbi:MAG: COR domain-containing protein [Cyanobacteria bacterium J06649_5]